MAVMKGPHLIAVGGLSGTGKSTLCRRLAGELGAAWIRSDEVRKELWGVPPTQKLPPAAYAPEFSAKTYAEADRRTEEALAAGRIVIVDMVFAKEAGRNAAADRAQRLGAGFTGLWLEAPADTLRARVDARTGDVSDADSAVVNMQLGYDLGAIGWRRIDAGGTAEQTHAQAVAALAGGLRRAAQPAVPKP